MPLIGWSPRGLRVTQNAYFSFLAHTKQLLLVKFWDTTAGIGSGTGQDADTVRMDRLEC